MGGKAAAAVARRGGGGSKAGGQRTLCSAALLAAVREQGTNLAKVAHDRHSRGSMPSVQEPTTVVLLLTTVWVVNLRTQEALAELEAAQADDNMLLLAAALQAVALLRRELLAPSQRDAARVCKKCLDGLGLSPTCYCLVHP